MVSSPSLPPALPWSARLAVSSNAQNLFGDKIHLPQSALEQLLSAATLASRNSNKNVEPDDPWAQPSNPSTEASLPHPLIVKLTNPRTRASAFAVPREFSAEEGTVAVSGFISKTLGLDITSDTKETGENAADSMFVDIHAASLPKGVKVRLRPLEAGYDDEDWKAILERYMREGFATVSEGTVLEVPKGHGRKGAWRFLVDEALPGGNVCVVDTDLEVEIEPLDEEQARETLKRRARKKGSGGRVKVEEVVEGEVLPGEELVYELGEWDKEKPVEIEMDVLGDEDEGYKMDVFVVTDKQHHKPRIDEYLWGDIGIETPKRIRLEPGNVELVDSSTLLIGIRGWQDMGGDEDGNGASPHSFTLRITQTEFSTSASNDTSSTDIPPSPDHTRCPNCTQWVISRTFTLHSAFCARNNLFCSTCHRVFHRSSPYYKTHWHCTHCTTSGLTPESYSKHRHTLHTPHPCPSCPYTSTSLPDLATHRTSTCPGKLHLCRFCHLLVPQSGHGDGSTPDPEVALTGLSRHEIECGGRTTECDRCSRRIKLRELEMHMRNHEMQRLTNPAPVRCANSNCTRGLSWSNGGNVFSLCDVCFGLLYAPGHDPEGKLLRGRLERWLSKQIMVGCRKTWCRNRYCKTGKANIAQEKGETVETKPIGVKEAMVIAKEAGVELCVDEATEMKRRLAEELEVESVIEGEGLGGYGKDWCRKAVEEGDGDKAKAKRWLGKEGVRANER